MTPPFPILYEDNHLLVVEKPVNVPVQADVTGDDDLLSMCRRYIKAAYNKPGEAFLALVHRLDRPVGGVMVFARTSKAAARLTDQFKGRTAKKRYAAVVVGCPPAEKRLVDFLLKDERTHSSAVVPEGTDGAKRAELCYRKLAACGDRALLDIELFTGRPHQIRVQLAHDGFPILGDQRYNPAARPGMQICLWAYALTIQHPTLGEEMTFFSLPGGSPNRGAAAEERQTACTSGLPDGGAAVGGRQTDFPGGSPNGGAAVEERQTACFGDSAAQQRSDCTGDSPDDMQADCTGAATGQKRACAGGAPIERQMDCFGGSPDGRSGFAAFPVQTALLPAFGVCRGVAMDDALLVVDKNAGVEVEQDLVPALESVIGPVYPVHRLDANTEGLVALARTEAMREQLLRAFRTHENIGKIYHAVVVGTPAQRAGTLEHTLQKDAAGAFVRVVAPGTPGGQPAKLAYRVLETRGGLSLVEIELYTGRTHQIRVQMAAIGCPVLGDDKYGDREINRRCRVKRQQLLAKWLTIGGRTFESLRSFSF